MSLLVSARTAAEVEKIKPIVIKEYWLQMSRTKQLDEAIEFGYDYFVTNGVNRDHVEPVKAAVVSHDAETVLAISFKLKLTMQDQVNYLTNAGVDYDDAQVVDFWKRQKRSMTNKDTVIINFFSQAKLYVIKRKPGGKYSIADQAVTARVAPETPLFPITLVAPYFMLMPKIIVVSKIEEKVKRSLDKNARVRFIKLHNVVKLTQHESNSILAIVEIEIRSFKEAEDFFNLTVWPDDLCHSDHTLKMLWSTDFPTSEIEASEFVKSYKATMQAQLVKKHMLSPSAVVARVASEEVILKPMVIPEYWVMNNGPNGTDPLGTLVHSDLAWLSKRGIKNVVPVKAAARSTRGIANAERKVMAVAYRLELTPKMMIDHAKSAISNLTDDQSILDFWEKQKAGHALAERRYMQEKRYPDLEIFSVKKRLGRWTLHRTSHDVEARVAPESKDKPWVGTFYVKMPGYFTNELNRAVARAVKEAKDLFGRTMKPSLYVTTRDKEIMCIGFNTSLSPSLLERIDSKGFIYDSEDGVDIRDTLTTMQKQIDNVIKRGYTVLPIDAEVTARVASETPEHAPWIKLVRDAVTHWPIHVKVYSTRIDQTELDRLKAKYSKVLPDLKLQSSSGDRMHKPLTIFSGEIDNPLQAVIFSQLRQGEVDIPTLNDGQNTWWFAHNVIENLGKQYIKVDSALYEMGLIKEDKPSRGLLDRLREYFKL
jgi:hypothetical protein